MEIKTEDLDLYFSTTPYTFLELQFVILVSNVHANLEPIKVIEIRYHSKYNGSICIWCKYAEIADKITRTTQNIIQDLSPIISLSGALYRAMKINHLSS